MRLTWRKTEPHVRKVWMTIAPLGAAVIMCAASAVVNCADDGADVESVTARKLAESLASSISVDSQCAKARLKKVGVNEGNAHAIATVLEQIVLEQFDRKRRLNAYYWLLYLTGEGLIPHHRGLEMSLRILDETDANCTDFGFYGAANGVAWTWALSQEEAAERLKRGLYARGLRALSREPVSSRPSVYVWAARKDYERRLLVSALTERLGESGQSRVLAFVRDATSVPTFDRVGALCVAAKDDDFVEKYGAEIQKVLPELEAECAAILGRLKKKLREGVKTPPQVAPLTRSSES